jgi:nucleoid-associated protein YgaU
MKVHVSLYATSYTVKQGDTLARIAGYMYGDESLWYVLHEANSHIIPDPNHIEPGMQLDVPFVTKE